MIHSRYLVSGWEPEDHGHHHVACTARCSIQHQHSAFQPSASRRIQNSAFRTQVVADTARPLPHDYQPSLNAQRTVDRSAASCVAVVDNTSLPDEATKHRAMVRGDTVRVHVFGWPLRQQMDGSAVPVRLSNASVSHIGLLHQCLTCVELRLQQQLLARSIVPSVIILSSICNHDGVERRNRDLPFVSCPTHAGSVAQGCNGNIWHCDTVIAHRICDFHCSCPLTMTVVAAKLLRGDTCSVATVRSTDIAWAWDSGRLQILTFPAVLSQLSNSMVVVTGPAVRGYAFPTASWTESLVVWWCARNERSTSTPFRPGYQAWVEHGSCRVVLVQCRTLPLQQVRLYSTLE